MLRPLLVSSLILSFAVSTVAGVQRLSIGGTPPPQAASYGHLELHHPTLDLVYLDNGSIYSVHTTTGVITPLLPNKAGWYSLAVSRDGSRLVAKAADSSIWSVPATGGTAVQLAAEVNSFVISADSMRVAYIQNGGAWSIPISGGVAVALTPVLWKAAGGVASAIETVPGSSLLVIKGRSSSPDPVRLYGVLPSGTGFLALTTNTSDITRYEINSTGTHAAYLDPVNDVLVAVNLSGPAHETVLRNLVFQRSQFHFTPTGTHVLFTDLGGGVETMYRVPVTGGLALEVITSGIADGIDGSADFRFSANGQYVVFVANQLDGVYAVPIAGSAAVKIDDSISLYDYTELGNSHAVFIDREAVSYATGATTTLVSNVWTSEMAPDGDHMVWVNRDGDIGQIKMDGTGLVVFGRAVVGNSLSARFNATGSRYVWLTGQGGGDEQLWVATLGLANSATKVLDLTGAPGLVSGVSLSPDARHAVYEETSLAVSYLTDIHVASLSDGSSSAVTTDGFFNYLDETQDVHFSDDSQWLVYSISDSSTSYQNIIHARRLSDGLDVTLSDPAAEASFVAIREAQGDVLFTIGDDLYRAPLDGSSGWENLTSGLAGEVRLHDLSEDECMAIISLDKLELLFFPLDGSSPPVTIATYTSYSTLSKAFPAFTEDGTEVLLMGNARASLSLYDIASGTTTQLYADGSNQINRMEQRGSTVVLEIEDSAGLDYLQAVSLATGTSTFLSSTSTSPDWLLTSDGSTVIHPVNSTGQEELYAIATTTATTMKLNGALPTGGNVTAFQLTPDEGTIVYYADQTADGVFELFAVPVTGGTASRISAAMTTSSFVQEDWQIASSQHVIYRSDLGTPGYSRLFGAPVDGGPLVLLSDPAMPAWSSVREFVPSEDGTQVVFTADPLLNGQWTLFSAKVEPAVRTIPNAFSVINAPHNEPVTVDDLETASDDLQITIQSSNAALLDSNNAVLSGSGSGRTLTLTPNTDAWGRTLVTLLVFDGNLTTVRQFTWTVTPDANDLPTNLSLTPSSIAENQPAGTLVGQLSASDADAWDIHSYALVSGSGDADNGLFLIQNNALRATVPFDYETRTAYSIRVRVTDFVGATFEKIINVTVQDLRGFSQPITLTTREGMGRFFEAQDFIDRFVLQDGGSLTKIRIESAPMNGSLNYQLGRRDIDTAAGAAQALATGDVNGDGRPDIIAVLPGSGDVVWYQNSGGASPTFTRRHIASVLNQPRDVAVGDVDKDGDLDVFVAEHGANKILCFRSSGGSAPTFAPITVFSGAGGLSSITTADIDGDTDLDVISTHPLGHRVIVHRNDGAATPGFIGTVLSTTETGAADAVVFDVDLDGDLDIVSAATTSGDIAWFEQNGASFIRRPIATSLPQPASLARADINGDSRSDLVIATRGDNSVNWYQNIPPATSGAALAFMPNLVSSSIAGVSSVLATDFTGDNVPDIIACSPIDGRILGFQTFRGGVVGFATHQLDKNAAGAAAVASTDFTANGRPDLVACHASANTIAWYKDERLLIGGDEVTVHELHKIRYQPYMSFTGDDTFGWRGHDGVQWSFLPSVVTMKVIAGEYWDWLVDAFGVESVSDFSESVTTWGDSADADADGRGNFLEYAFGGDPTSGSDSGDAVATAPQTETDGTTYFHLSFIMRHSDPGLIYTPEVTADFTTWNSGPTYFQHVAPDVVLDADFTQVTYRYLVPVTSSSAAGFFRVKVERAP